MTRTLFDDRTYFKHTKNDKKNWKQAAKIENKNLSDWIRNTLNEESALSLTPL